MKKERKQVKRQKKQEVVLSDKEQKQIQIIALIAVTIGFMILGFHGIAAYRQATRPTVYQDAALKNIILDDGDDEEELEEPCCDEDLNKYEIIKGIVRLFPKKNDSKVKGKNVYKEFDLTRSERHAAKLTFYYENYKFVYQYINGSGDTSKITVYNKKTNKVLYTNSNIKTALIDENDKYYDLLPTVSGGKLHLLKYNTSHCYVDGYGDLSPYLDYITIKLDGNKLKEKIVLELKGFEFGEIPACK